MLKFLDEYETQATYMVALPAITGMICVTCPYYYYVIYNHFFFKACLYGDIGSDDFVNALQQAKYLDILVDFTKEDWLRLLKQ